MQRFWRVVVHFYTAWICTTSLLGCLQPCLLCMPAHYWVGSVQLCQLCWRRLPGKLHGQRVDFDCELNMTKQIDCPNWSPWEKAGRCAKGYYGGRPSLGTCTLVCQLGKNQTLVGE